MHEATIPRTDPPANGSTIWPFLGQNQSYISSQRTGSKMLVPDWLLHNPPSMSPSAIFCLTHSWVPYDRTFLPFPSPRTIFPFSVDAGGINDPPGLEFSYLNDGPLR